MGENNFKNWIIVKEIIHNRSRTVDPKVGEIWLVSIGYNIGCEIYGKGNLFIRPVLVIAKDSNICMAIPLSSKLKSSINTLIILDSKNMKHTAHIMQIRTIDKLRFFKRKSKLNDEELANTRNILMKIISR